MPQEFRTIQQAVDAANGGETIVVSPGVHRGNVNVVGKKITIKSDTSDSNPDLSIINNTVLTCPSDGLLALRGGASVSIQGVVFANIKGAAIFNESSTCSIRWVTFTNILESCIFSSGGGFSTVLDSFFVSNGGYCFRAVHANASFVRCKFYKNNQVCGADNAWNGVTEFDNCVLYDNELGVFGIYGHRINMVNCTVFGNRVGFSISNGSLINCIVYGNNTEYIESQAGSKGLTVWSSLIRGGREAIKVTETKLFWDDANIDSDPLFVDAIARDFRLSGTSPAINSGDNLSVTDPRRLTWTGGCASWVVG